MQPVGVWESQQRAFASEAAEEPRKPIPGTKVCVRCKVERPSSDFRGSGKSRDGLQHFCIPCKVHLSLEHMAGSESGAIHKNVDITLPCCALSYVPTACQHWRADSNLKYV